MKACSIWSIAVTHCSSSWFAVVSRLTIFAFFLASHVLAIRRCIRSSQRSLRREAAWR